MAQPRRQTALANASAVQHGNAAVLRRTMASATAAPPQPSTGNAEGDAGFVEKEKAKLLKGHIVQSYLNLVRDQEIQLDPKQLELATELQRLANDLETFYPPSLEALDDNVLAQIDAVKKARAAELARLEAEQGEEGPANRIKRSREAKAGIVTLAPQQSDWRTGGDQELTPTASGVPPIKAINSTRTAPAHIQAAAAAAAKVVAEMKARQGEADEEAMPTPKGVYLWGPVGCGKTMLLDLFFQKINVAEGRKQRVHFHSFMRDVFRHLHELSTQSTMEQKDVYDHNLLRPLAKAISKQSYVLCFDEIQIPDIGTASVLHRLFEYLCEYGVIVVGTSNRAPHELYQGHFNDTHFSPWVEMMDDKWTVRHLDSHNDYRRAMGTTEDTAATAPFRPGDPLSESFFYPLGREAVEKMEASWAALIDGKEVGPTVVEVFGRTVPVPYATEDGVARFDFDVLCNTALGPADYLAIARSYHTVFVSAIPELNMRRRDQARRFISLVDALYECKTNIYCDAMTSPDNIFVAETEEAVDHYDAMLRESLGEIAYDMGYSEKVFTNQLFTGEEEVFASERCVSRLMEMRGGMYKMSPHEPGMGFAGLDTDCLDFDQSWSSPADERGTGSNGGGRDGAAGVGASADAEADEDNEGRPRFNRKHFWGAGWWEKLIPGRK